MHKIISSQTGALVALVALAATFLMEPNAARAAGDANLDKALAQHAAKVIGYLRSKNYHNVGVLKFLVQKGQDKPSDNVGPLNLTIANRLEVALVLADPDDQLKLIRHASETVAKSKSGRANHLTAAGRKALFRLSYEPAWGNANEYVKADAFITGLVQLSPDFKKTTVHLQAFDNPDSDPAEIDQFTVATDERTLTEAGRSYRLRALLRTAPDEAATYAQEAEAGRAEPALKNSLVGLEIYYDDQKVDIQYKNGQAWVKGPYKGQTVRFVLKNRSAQPYGAVLRVNGENTLYKERSPSSQCRKWVLDPAEEVTVVGFQTDQATAEKFEVLSAEESEEREINYGEHVGTFSLDVFASRAAEDKDPLLSDNEESRKLIAINTGEVPANKPIKLKSLQDELKKGKPKISGGERSLLRGKGIVVSGAKIDSGVQKVAFETYPIPVVSATIRYYTPSGGK
jgi:hypothetical protein